MFRNIDKIFGPRQRRVLAVIGVITGIVSALAQTVVHFHDIWKWCCAADPQSSKPAIHDTQYVARRHKAAMLSPKFSERWSAIEFAELFVWRGLAVAPSGIMSQNVNRNQSLPVAEFWQWGYGVDYAVQGDGEGAIQTVWYSCLKLGPKPKICLESAQYRKKHHLRSRQWRG